MRFYEKIISGGVLLAGLAGLLGCDDTKGPELKKAQEVTKRREVESAQPTSFAAVPSAYKCGIALTSGDFDGDGTLDLVVAAYFPGNTREARIYLMRNQNGKFSEPAHFATVPFEYKSGISLTSGDFDGDGTLDLVVAAHYPGGVREARLYKFKNDGKGNFSQ